MNLITLNTQDAAGYAQWAKTSTPTIAKANGAMAMALLTNGRRRGYGRSLPLELLGFSGEAFGNLQCDQYRTINDILR